MQRAPSGSPRNIRSHLCLNFCFVMHMAYSVLSLLLQEPHHVAVYSLNKHVRKTRCAEGSAVLLSQSAASAVIAVMQASFTWLAGLHCYGSERMTGMPGTVPESLYWLLAVNGIVQHSVDDWRGVVGLQQQAELTAFQVCWLVLIPCHTMQSRSIIIPGSCMQQASA